MENETPKKSSFFSWFTRASSNGKKPMGAELGVKEGVKAQMQKLQGDVVKTSRIVQNNLEKYKEVKKLNEAITKSYVQNLVVFRDVNEMLQSCLSVFKSLEAEFIKLEEATGRELNTTDFDYLSNMTRAKMESLNTELNNQAEVLKKVYTMYGRPEELNRIILAQSNMNKVVSNASVAYDKIVGKKKKNKDETKLTNANVFNDTPTVANEANATTEETVASTGETTQSGGVKKKSKGARNNKRETPPLPKAPKRSGKKKSQ